MDKFFRDVQDLPASIAQPRINVEFEMFWQMISNHSTIKISASPNNENTQQ